MEGLLGLSNNIKTTEAAGRDLFILERMDSRVRQDRKEEVDAQKEEQLMYEKMYQISDQMLEKDRKAINKRISMAQDQIYSHIKDSGGSRKRFMEQGGLSLTNSITNDIMRSDQAITYQENKKNLAKILEAREKGLGHLISPRDLQSAEDYENNPNGGKITWSGLMSEIEIPPSANFDSGTEIPLEYILSNESNMMRIKSNYAMTYPDRPEPKYEDIYEFAREMGYGGTGSSTVKLREEARIRERDARYNSNKTTDKKNEKNSFIGQVSAYTTLVLDKGLTVKEMNDKEKYPDGYIEYQRENHASTNKILKGKNTLTSVIRALPEKGLDITDIPAPFLSLGLNLLDKAFSELYGLKESYEFMPESKGVIATRIFGNNEDNAGLGYDIKDGKLISFLPDDQMYRMDGAKLGDGHSLEEDNRGNYVIEGTFTAFKGKAQGDDILYMNAYNDDGVTYDEDTQKVINEAYEGDEGGGEMKPTFVIALRNAETDDLYYKEIDITDPYMRNVMKNAVGKDDDLTDVVDQENRTLLLHNNIEKMKNDEEIAMRGTMNTLEKGVFSESGLEFEGRKYWGAGSAGGNNRASMMKSFYTAIDAVGNNEMGTPGSNEDSIRRLIDRNSFTVSAIHGKIESRLKDYDENPYEIVTEWLKNVNDGDVGSLGKRRNTDIAKKWHQLMQLQENM